VADSTRLEQAILDILTAETECTWHIGCDIEECHKPRARAIAAAITKLKAKRSRSRASAKKAGSGHERVIADYLRDTVDDRVDRKVRTGARDTGDIAGLRVHGQRVAIECKNTRAWEPGQWLREAERERVNDGALAGLVVAKRHGTADPGQQIVLMTLDDLVAIITGSRPGDVFGDLVQLGQEIQGDQ